MLRLYKLTEVENELSSSVLVEELEFTEENKIILSSKCVNGYVLECTIGTASTVIKIGNEE